MEYRLFALVLKQLVNNAVLREISETRYFSLPKEQASSLPSFLRMMVEGNPKL